MLGSPRDLVAQLAVRQREAGLGYDGHALVVAGAQDVEQGWHGCSSSSPDICRFQIFAQNSLFARISERNIPSSPLSVKSVINVGITLLESSKTTLALKVLISNPVTVFITWMHFRDT